ncbi:DEAD/DEAH box helicase [Vibrio sp. SS-MA-C1-2]|uniref:DEAD/DEAH box helicase n=1 Tax=Vibrio sp. SS-MA-C1-2 TaxID=2908646 RepID=UPI001F404971|nr:DEAD/DEAH box helicase [Vibrio sp. SS-MA-C1-2]UJF17426.1 DEAD/DEAH box helicase [Vibrio sp. SS-MA-C1-2]
MSFSTLGLSDKILKAVEAKGYSTPSPIQAQAIPAVLEGKDVMAAAQTGTGKTAGFTLPLLQRLSGGQPAQAKNVRALVLTPTRELAAQVGESVSDYGKNLPLKSTVIFGGVGANPQIAKLSRGVDILVATPGRLLDLYNQRAVKFDQLEILILDEADRMLDMGFIHDIKRILKVLPRDRQNLMFSATFSDEIRTLAKGLVNDPVEISVTPNNSTANSVKQWVCPVDQSKKGGALVKLIKQHKWQQVLVFSRTKHGANRLAKNLTAKNINAAAIHGNKSQNARTKALAEFKSGEIRVLVATDIAARGLDIEQLPQVVNFDLPNVPEDYVHRIGRTGRAGQTGEAISLVSGDESKLLRDIERLINKNIPREEIEGFEPSQPLPVNDLSKKSSSRGGNSRNNSRSSARNSSSRGNSANNNSQRRKPNSRNGENKSSEANDNNSGNGQRRRNNSGNSQNSNSKNGAKPSGQRRQFKKPAANS